jgi:hypothetical protein
MTSRSRLSHVLARTSRTVLALTLLWSALSGWMARAESVFPVASGHNLNGGAVAIPRDLKGSTNLVYVAFLPDQQASVDSWQPFAAEMTRRYPDFHAYQLPVISNGYTFFRGYLDSIMRGAIPDTAARASTITLFVDKRAFDRALGIASEREISVFLITPRGEILWRTTGAFDASHPPDIAGLVARASPAR